MGEFTFQKLNLRTVLQVQIFTRLLYFKVIACLEEASSNDEKVWKKALEIADLGLLLGFPFGSLDLTKVADLLSKHLPKSSSPPVDMTVHDTQGSNEWIKKLKLDNQIECLSCPSLEFFHFRYFKRNKPVKLTNCMDHWPALRLWSNLGYIKEKAGDRTVPIEIGKHYADDSYSQKLMRISDFIEQYFKPNAEKIGYLAQHQLFDQVFLYFCFFACFSSFE